MLQPSGPRRTNHLSADSAATTEIRRMSFAQVATCMESHQRPWLSQLMDLMQINPDRCGSTALAALAPRPKLHSS